MKRITILLAALLASTALLAQPRQRLQLPPNTFLSTIGETNVTSQGSYTPDFKIDGSKAKINNVILLIGDGMGLGAVASALYANGGELTMMNLKTMGYVRTQSANDFTTDSAASGTAYATGHKTNNGYVGVDTDGNNLVNIPEAITPLGYTCGVVTTDGITGATPAAFYAHQKARGDSDKIWEDLPDSKLIFFAGGSKKDWEKLPLKTQENIKAQYSVTFSADEARAAAGSNKLGLLPENVGEGRGDYLPATTQMAIDFLSARTKKGFFLMVEGAHIDHEAHNNKATLTQEALDFDKAVEVALRFAEKDGHTLVIISADHETGAVVIRKGNMEENYIQMSFSSRSHSPMPVPLFAYGPGSYDFRGVQENSDVSNKIRKIFLKK